MPSESEKKKIIRKLLIETMRVEGFGAVREQDGTISYQGFNQKTYDAWRDSKKLRKRPVTEITTDESADLFEEEILGRNGIDKLPRKYWGLVGDAAFNSGPANAARIMQRTVGADEDAIIGPNTLKALEEYEMEGGDFINDYSNNRVDFINSSPVIDEKLKPGLNNRVEKIRQRELDRLPINGVTVEFK